MLIHAIVPKTKVNGPGTRFAVWVQGCSRRCEGCFNPETWAVDGRGTVMSVESIVALVPENEVDGVTVSGGEPFEQSGELCQLLNAAHDKGLQTLVYSGYTYEELSAKKETLAALKQTDLLIDGAYDRHFAPLNSWTGSGNQRVYALKDGVIERDMTAETGGGQDSEIIIDETGLITATGFLPLTVE